MMVTMEYVREKVAPWEKYTDGEWHEVRHGPDEESREESARQFRRHWESMRSWVAGKDLRGQLSRTDHGRIIRVRFTTPQQDPDAGHLHPMGRTELGRHLITALELLRYAAALRQHGEGDGQTWTEFDRATEALFRKIRGSA